MTSLRGTRVLTSVLTSVIRTIASDMGEAHTSSDWNIDKCFSKVNNSLDRELQEPPGPGGSSPETRKGDCDANRPSARHHGETLFRYQTKPNVGTHMVGDAKKGKRKLFYDYSHTHRHTHRPAYIHTHLISFSQSAPHLFSLFFSPWTQCTHT